METMNLSSQSLPENAVSEVEHLITQCHETFNQLLAYAQHPHVQDAHAVEATILKRLLALGLCLLRVFFASHKCGDYGCTLTTTRGIARRGRLSAKNYFSIFGKLTVNRYLYYLDDKESFAPLDIVLNLPLRCYSYLLSDWVNHLNVHDVYGETVTVLKKFFGLELSISVVETITDDSAVSYEPYYDLKHTLSPSTRPEASSPRTTPAQETPVSEVEKACTPASQEAELTVASFDGKGVAMIKKEAAKITARQGKGKKRQKKKEALVGVTYTIAPHVRTSEEVARNLVSPEKNASASKTEKPAKAEQIRYLASIKKPKRTVMRELLRDIETQSYVHHPLLCLIDGSLGLLRAVTDVFKQISNKVIIVDIMHVLEYIWLIAHLKHHEGSDAARQYVYETLVLILQGGVKHYIKDLQKDLDTGTWKASQRKTFTKVLTYLKNHAPYMHYDEYLSCGYPIATGVVESACGHLVKDRMERSGARWSIEGAEAVLRVRSVIKSLDWDDYWTFHTTQFRDNTFLEIEDLFLNGREEKLA